MNIGLASVAVVTRDTQRNVAAMVAAMKLYKGKCDFLVFGETALQGFDSLTWDYEIDRYTAVVQVSLPICKMQKAARCLGMGVSFGYLERSEDKIYSSQIVIDQHGEVVYTFRRVSQGWKAYWRTDHHYCEGDGFETFYYDGKKIAVALCGDLWTEGRPEEMKALNPDVVLWPVWCDFPCQAWNQKVKYEYAQQAARCGERVLYVNPFCMDTWARDAASGGAAYFQGGTVMAELPAGKPGVLIVSI